MGQLVNPARRCPRCGSREYAFRGRKEVAAEAGRPAAVETRYACKACGHVRQGLGALLAPAASVKPAQVWYQRGVPLRPEGQAPAVLPPGG